MSKKKNCCRHFQEQLFDSLRQINRSMSRKHKSIELWTTHAFCRLLCQPAKPSYESHCHHLTSAPLLLWSSFFRQGPPPPKYDHANMTALLISLFVGVGVNKNSNTGVFFWPAVVLDCGPLCLLILWCQFCAEKCATILLSLMLQTPRCETQLVCQNTALWNRDAARTRLVWPGLNSALVFTDKNGRFCRDVTPSVEGVGVNLFCVIGYWDVFRQLVSRGTWYACHSLPSSYSWAIKKICTHFGGKITSLRSSQINTMFPNGRRATCSYLNVAHVSGILSSSKNSMVPCENKDNKFVRKIYFLVQWLNLSHFCETTSCRWDGSSFENFLIQFRPHQLAMLSIVNLLVFSSKGKFWGPNVEEHLLYLWLITLMAPWEIWTSPEIALNRRKAKNKRLENRRQSFHHLNPPAFGVVVFR